MTGVDPSAIRQLLLQHMLLPLVSIQATHSADRMFQAQLQNELTLVLQVFKHYANNAKHGVPNQAYRITNTQLITRTYGLFPVRFEPSLPVLLTVHNSTDDRLKGLFSISSLEQLLRSLARDQQLAEIHPDEELYLDMFRKVITSNRVTLFDTLNHPVAQVFVVQFGENSIEDVRQLIVDFRNFAFPKYFQINDILIHVFVLYDAQLTKDAELASFQTALRTTLSVSSSAIPMFQTSFDDAEFVTMSKFENMTIDEEVQFNSMQQSSGTQEENSVRIQKSLDTALRGKLYEFISKVLIPHMEKKIRVWDDLILAPKKSITGRFFSVSRKLFNNSNEQLAQNSSLGSYNSQGNYYYRSSPEQAIRKLADWSLMLKDFKYAYSTYDIIKKDYINDKAWLYVASTQEMCIISLLLAQTQPLASEVMPPPPDKNTLRKIRHDIIEPYIDNLTYTFKSRFNVKAYSIRSYIIVAELLLNMSIMFNIPWWWSDLIESYLIKTINEIDAHLSSSGPLAVRAILYERLGYAKASSLFIPGEYKELAQRQLTNRKAGKEEEIEEGHFKNISKIAPPMDNAVKGLTRSRKSALWYILSMKEWLLLGNKHQVKHLIGNITPAFTISEETGEWYDRDDLLLAKIKTFATD